ncbi:MAG TPA: site-2 protease family protein [Thermoplasmata archaeon]|nr:site-2 protease family protein [Thermoplasmata archaeon]
MMAPLTTLDGVVIFLLLVLAYGGIVAYLYRTRRIGPDKALSLFGPALMIKTRRGRGWLDRVGRFRRFWSVVADVGILLAALSMLVTVVILLLEGILATQVPASAAVPPQEALGLPVINPIIPLGYGVVALVVGVVLHELAHGVVARSQQIGVKSLGVLWFVVPVGAFVEQDDEQMTQASRRRRTRVAAAGVLANFVLAVVFFSLLAAVVSSSVQPNATGVGVLTVVPNSPASNNSLVAGDIITNVNGAATPNAGALDSALANSTPGEQVAVTFYSASSQRLVVIHPTLAKSQYNATRGFLGVEISELTPADTLQELTWPAGSQYGALFGLVTWIALPIIGLEPVGGVVPSFFHLVGPLALLGSGGFWIVANLLYWLAWMNLLLGLSNTLPLVPLDGGLLVRDFAGSILARLRRGWSAARLDAVTGRLAVASSLLVVFLLVWILFAPRL